MSPSALRCRPFVVVFALFILIVSLLSALDRKLERVLNGAVSVQAAAGVAAPSASSAPVVREFGKLPISFEINQGQTDGSVQFLARTAGYTLFLTPGQAVFSVHAVPSRAKPGADGMSKLQAPIPADIVRMQLIGSNSRAKAAGVDPLPGKANYFIGNDPASWHTDVPTFAKVRYSDVYPGIDLIYYGNQEGRLEHDFVVAPGADPKVIEIGLESQQKTAADQSGGLVVHTPSGNIAMRRPVAYQIIDGKRKVISASYVMADDRRIGVELGSYDRTELLVIDPVIEYTAIFGGSSGPLGGGSMDEPFGIAIDGEENVYVTGRTIGANFPIVNGFQSTTLGADAFVSKINAAGTALIYSTYLGGLQAWGVGIGVDDAGRAYVVGNAYLSFPVKNAYQPDFRGNDIDAFLTALGPAGDTLVYSTYFSADNGSFGNAIAVDGEGNAYIAGAARGSGLPAIHSVYAKGVNFVAKFNNTGTPLYSSIYSNSMLMEPTTAIAIDAEGAAYIAGPSQGLGSTTSKAFKNFCTLWKHCGFAGKLSPSGDSREYFNYFPGEGSAMAVDSSGQTYIAGSTPNGYLVTGKAFQKTYGGGNTDGFVGKLNASGTGLMWSTYFGGSGDDTITSLAIDQHRTVYITGTTTSRDLPLKAPVQNSVPGNEQIFVATLSGSLSSIAYYSTYFGTSSAPYNGITAPPAEIAVDKKLNAYLATPAIGGGIQSTPGALNRPGSGWDIAVAKLVIVDDISTALRASENPVAHGKDLTYTIAVTSKGPDFGYNVRITDALPMGTTFVSYNAGGGTCTAPAVGGTGTLRCHLLQLDKDSTWTVTLTVHVNATAGGTLSNTASGVSNMQDFVIGNNSATITTRVD